MLWIRKLHVTPYFYLHMPVCYTYWEKNLEVEYVCIFLKYLYYFFFKHLINEHVLQIDESQNFLFVDKPFLEYVFTLLLFLKICYPSLFYEFTMDRGFLYLFSVRKDNKNAMHANMFLFLIPFYLLIQEFVIQNYS